MQAIISELVEWARDEELPKDNPAFQLMAVLEGVEDQLAQARSAGHPDPLRTIDRLPLRAMTRIHQETLPHFAECALARLGVRDYAPAVTRLLYHDNPHVRRAAIAGFAGLCDPSYIPPLGELISASAEDVDIRSLAAEMLGRMKLSAAVPVLVQVLDDSETALRKHALSALGGIGDRDAVSHIRPLLHDEAASVRRDAVEALGRIGGPEAIGPLAEALEDDATSVRKHAAAALARCGDPRALEPLMVFLRDREDFGRASLAQALGQLGDPRAADALLEALREPLADLRSEAALALGKIGAVSARTELKERAEQDKSLPVREAATQALALLPAETEEDIPAPLAALTMALGPASVAAPGVPPVVPGAAPTAPAAAPPDDVWAEMKREMADLRQEIRQAATGRPGSPVDALAALMASLQPGTALPTVPTVPPSISVPTWPVGESVQAVRVMEEAIRMLQCDFEETVEGYLLSISLPDGHHRKVSVTVDVDATGQAQSARMMTGCGMCSQAGFSQVLLQPPSIGSLTTRLRHGEPECVLIDQVRLLEVTAATLSQRLLGLVAEAERIARLLLPPGI